MWDWRRSPFFTRIKFLSFTLSTRLINPIVWAENRWNSNPFAKEKINFGFNFEKRFLHSFGPKDKEERTDSYKEFQEIHKIEIEPNKNAVQ